MNGYATGTLTVMDGAKAELGAMTITRTDIVDRDKQAPHAGTNLVVKAGGSLAIESITVTHQDYASHKENDTTKWTSRGWGKLVVERDGDKKGVATVKENLTIEAGGQFELEGDATIGRVDIAAASTKPDLAAGTLTLGTGTLTLNNGASKNAGKILQQDGTESTLHLAEGASFVNEGLVSVKNLTLDSAYTSLYGLNTEKTKGTDSTIVTLNKGAKFIDKNIPTTGITIATGKTVDFDGGNFYKDENTAFNGALTVSGEAYFDGDYTFSSLAVKSGTVGIDRGSLTVTGALTSTGTITIDEAGVLTVNADKIGFTTKDGKIDTTKAGTDIAGTFTNKGKFVIQGLTGEISSEDLAKLSDKFGQKGIVDFGALTVTELKDVASQVDYEKVKTLGGASIDQLKNVTVTEITDGTNVKGSYGSLQYKEGATSAKIGGTLELNNGGLLISDAKNKAVQLDLVAGDVLRTTGENALIGEINGAGTSGNNGHIQVVSGSLASAVQKTADDGKKTYYNVTANELTVAEGASFESLGTVKLNTGTVSGLVNIGTLEVVDTLNLEGGATIENFAKGIVNVGNALKAGNAVFGTVSGTVFADPAWENSTEHSNVAVDKVASGGKVEIGQNSLGVIGSRDIKVAQAALDKTGHVIAKSGDKAVNSAVLVLGQKDATGAAVAIEGTVFASNATTGPTAGAGNGTAAGSLMIIDASSLGTGNAAVFKNAVDNAGILYLANVKAGDKIKVSEGALTLGTGSTGVFESDAGRLLTVAPTTTGGATLAVDLDETKVAGFEGLTTLDTIVDMYKTGAYNSASAKFNKFLMDNDNGMTTADIIAVGNDAAMLGATAAAGSVTMDAISAFNDTLAGRTSILAQRGEGVNVWADVYGGHNEAKKLMDGRGYKSDVYGGVLGADTVVNGFTIGAALTIGTGDTDSANTLVKSSTDSDFVGFSVYGAKAFGSFNVAADLGYMQGSNDVSVKSFGIGDFSADTSAFTMGVRGEYMVDAGSFKIVPHAGLRFTHLTTDDFEAAYTTDFDDMNIFQAPVGVTVAGSFEASGWNLAPMLDLSIVPAFGDKDADMTLGIAGVATKTALSTQIVDSNPVQMTLGLSAQKDAWTFGLNWKLGAGSDDRMNNTFNATVNYAF